MTQPAPAAPSLREQPEPALVVALVGQPNVGKSSVFNDLTGQAQYVSNWPGKTSEPKRGTCAADGRLVQVVDLPGAYSLSANSSEERVVRDFLIHQQPDVVALIVNATALERNLYLLAELLALPVKIVIGLNMVDVAAQQGITIEPHVLEAALGLPVVPLNAARSQGVQELIEAAVCLAAQPQGDAPNRPEIRADHRHVLQELQYLITPYVPEPYPVDWVALKLLEGDRQITEMLQAATGRAVAGRTCHPDAARGRHPGDRQRALRVDRAHDARCRHPAARRAADPDRPDRPGRDAPTVGYVDPAGHFGCALLADLRPGHAAANLAGCAPGAGRIRMGAGAAAGGPALADRADRQWDDRRRGHGADPAADPADLLRVPGHPGRRGLHGAGGLRDGPLHAPDGTARQELSAALPGLWLQCAGRDGGAHH